MKVELSEIQKFNNWLTEKIYLDAIAPSAAKRVINRGEVYWCKFGYNIGSEIRKTTSRPCIIVQSDTANHYSSNTIVCPITHCNKNIKCLIPIGSYYDSNGKQILNGYVNIANLTTISKARLGDKIIDRVSKSTMDNIDKAIIIQLGMIKKYNNLLKKCTKQSTKIQTLSDENRNLAEKINQIKDLVNYGDLEKIKNIL